MIFITNSLSVNMFPLDTSLIMKASKITRKKVQQILSQAPEWMSRVSRSDLALFISSELMMDIPPNRKPVRLRDGDTLIVCQFVGPKIQHLNVLELPGDARIEYWLINALK